MLFQSFLGQRDAEVRLSKNKMIKKYDFKLLLVQDCKVAVPVRSVVRHLN